MSENIYEEALVIEKSSKYTYVTCPKYAEDIRIPHWIGEIRNIQLQMWDSVGITTVIDNIAFKFCLLKRASSIPNVDEETETELLINRLHIRSLQLELNDAESRLKQLNRQLKMMEQSKELANFNCCVCLTNQVSK
ncbi:hypothetical protein WR25_16895 [Diploscapter pachys]|uniref:Uncharacterized protein n=1 Tax=Diploscapter pachys TaxID=2018661 RepID=A0A2A2LK50_9BILA|nr:hypothetical protein WR25_16895 [Diploscapter pachys]